uniref:GntR family transcriptional regulator n=1 Tax=Actinokineospora sp. CA-119265 TaxID=3239890 RepID=UPI003F49B41E
MVCGMSGPTDARPFQVQVADDLRAKIETGELAPHSQLPTYDALAEQHMVSVGVSRAAVNLLVQEGLVVKRQGKGVFVRERARPRRHGIERYARSRWKAGKAVLVAEAESQGHAVSQQLRALERVDAPPEEVADRLEFAPSDDQSVWVRRRTTFVDSRPNQLADSYYPMHIAERVPALKEEQTGPGGGYARLEEAGFELAEINEEWGVRMPVGPESVALKLLPGTPVIDLIRTTYDKEGRPIEVMVGVLAGDMVRFSYRFPIPE